MTKQKKPFNYNKHGRILNLKTIRASNQRKPAENQQYATALC